MSDTQLVVVSGDTALAQYQGITREQKDLLKRTMCKGASDDELQLYMAVCNRKQLDPFSGQIHGVKRAGEFKFQIGIDGFRLMAQRSGLYKGMDPILWCGDDGKWVSPWLARTDPVAAIARVWRTDREMPAEVIAYWGMYSQGNAMWKKGGAHMLAKCAEALAIRCAFPVEVGGFFIPEELPPDAGTTAPTRDDDDRVVADSLIHNANEAKTHDLLRVIYERAAKALVGDEQRRVLLHVRGRRDALNAANKPDEDPMPDWDAEPDVEGISADEVKAGG